MNIIQILLLYLINYIEFRPIARSHEDKIKLPTSQSEM